MPVSTGMGRSLSLIAVVAVASVLLPVSAPAEEASPYLIGEECAANALVTSRTSLVAGWSGSSPYPKIVPRGGTSVITMWSVNTGPELGTLPLRLEVYEFAERSPAYRKVGESRMETVTTSRGNDFQTRIPVEGGELVGLDGPHGMFVCNGDDKAVSLQSGNGGVIGESRLFRTETGIGTPVWARVEPDRDGDGFGDQTQDRCPGTGSRGDDCSIDISVPHVAVKRRAIVLEVVPEAWALIKARADFLWYLDRERPGESRSLVGTWRETKRKSVGKNSPSTIRIPLPKQILERLQGMRPGRSMAAHIVIYITDRDGWSSEERMRVAMPGRR
jgi:hypothetical protein